MLNRFIHCRLVFGAVCLALAGPACAHAQGYMEERGAVTITLMADTVLDDSIIRLDQIAKLSGGPLALRQRIGRLDVADMKIGIEQIMVSRELVRFRLMLAGIDEACFRLNGAKRAVVTESDDPASARKIMAVANDTVRSRYPAVTLSRDITSPQLDLTRSDRVRLEARSPVPTTRPGVVRVDVAVLVNGKTRDVVPVSFDIAASEPAPRFGNSGAGLRKTGYTEPTRASNEVLIKTRDLVRMIVQVGAVQVVASGEAQQDGKMGDLIRVRNVDSNRIVNARIEAAGVVLVDQ